MPLVGVGASAGGLEALTSFVAALPIDSGMAFFVVQHLDPALPSALVQLLARAGPLRVVLARDGATIEPNVIHVAQPGSQLTIEGGVMRQHTNGKTSDRPIDAFLRSLARCAGQQSIGILLSGSGRDGCLGLTAVREAGGFTLAQDGSAQFDGMPRAAIDAGVVDLVLSPSQIAAELAALVRHPYVRGEVTSGSTTASDDEAFNAILAALQARRGVGFARYRRPTLQRRILRRMVVRKVDSLVAYARLLVAEPWEIDALFEEVLINVTEFFRDAETFERLRVCLQQRLAADRDPSSPLRIWVVGCSTGEEAYSLAMLAEECATAMGREPAVRVFATDVSEAALAVARAGIYSPEQCACLGEARRERFFRPHAGNLQVLQSLRERCVFARHDITRDPPFSRMDLVGCRNLLIYFGSELQQSIMPTLHYALRLNGLLFLGRSESVGRHDDLFAPVDREHAIYMRRPSSRARVPEPSRIASLRGDRWATTPEPLPSPLSLESQADRMVLGQYAPPGVVVDTHWQVVQFRGDTTRFMRHGAGRATLDVLAMAHADLRRPLSESLMAARQAREEVVRHDITLRDDDDDAQLTMTLRVLPLEADAATGYLVTFTTTAEQARKGLDGVVRGYGRRLIDRLLSPPKGPASTETSKLLSTRAELGRLIDEHQTRTQELNAANEQVLSSNEELQSTNEELQAAKEEVLASNEELTTVNEELEARNLMLSRANDDLANLLSSTNIPIVMVGQDLRIRWFTPSAGRVLNLILGDIGRPIDHIKPALQLPALETLVAPVLADLRMREHVVQNSEGHWFRVAVTPYRTAEGTIDGAVIAIVDVDALKRAEADLLQQRTHAEWIVDTVREPLVIVDDALRIVSANPAYFRVFDATADAIGGRLLHAADDRWNRDDLRAWLRASFPGGGGETETFELSIPGDDPRQLQLEAHPILRGADPALLLIAIHDVTELRERERLEAELVNGVLQAQAEERESLARELHDETGQALSALLVGLRALSEHIDDASGRALVHELRERARELIDTVGRLARGLHPTTVEELGLVQAVRELAEGWSRVHAISLDLDAEPDVAIDGLPPALQLAIYRVFQEGLTNVARHARAGEVTVVLHQEDAGVHIQVADDGIGFDVNGEPSPGLGLRLMKRRVAQLGGRVSLETQPGSGTLLDVHVPLGASDV
jgi:two-component system CheB/CheR fusion protein